MKNKIILGDSLNELKSIENESVDVVFADPPYNMQIEGNLLRPNQTIVSGVGNHQWDRFSSFSQYDEFSRQWLREVYRILKNDGTIWVMGSYHNIFRIGTILQDLGFWILNDIIWQKTNPLPNFKGTRFTNSHENIIWACKNKSAKYVFNYHSMKIQNDDKQMQSIWNFPICSGKEREKIDNKTAHPTQKPLVLLQRILLASSKHGDCVLDPFLGTGTTAVAAKMLGRSYIGIENNQEYFQIAQKRLENTQILDESSVSFLSEPKSPRVSLRDLISCGLLSVGDKLVSKDEKNIVTILLDGSLKASNNIKGSIHQVAKVINNDSPVNGWTFWSIYINGELILLDKLRKKYFS